MNLLDSQYAETAFLEVYILCGGVEEAGRFCPELLLDIGALLY